MTKKDLDRAERMCRLLNIVHAHAWSFMWPNGCCVTASVTTAPLLRASLDVELRVVTGLAAGRSHAWIESPEGDVIDQTYGQFDDGYPVRVLPAHDGSLGHCADTVLTLDEEEEVRRAIHPKHLDSGGRSGWMGTGRTLVFDLFSSYPRLAPNPARGGRLMARHARARHGDPATSHTAAKRASAGGFSSSQQAVMAVMRVLGKPVLDEELVREYMKRYKGLMLPQQSESGIRSRRAELARAGKLVEHPFKGRMTTGGLGRTWRIPNEGDQ